MKAQIIVMDPPWKFNDKLGMSSVKRGAASNYSVLNDNDIINLSVNNIAASDAILCLWCPSSKLDVGLKAVEKYGFKFKQTHVWVKTKKDPLFKLKKDIKNGINSFNLDDILNFGMGHLFRNVHELVLVGTKGKIYKKLKNKSQRTVHFWPTTKHSTKPEILQDKLDIMFKGSNCKKIEMFARRQRKGWICVGNEVKGPYFGEDIRDSIDRLSRPRKNKNNENSTTQLQL